MGGEPQKKFSETVFYDFYCISIIEINYSIHLVLLGVLKIMSHSQEFLDVCSYVMNACIIVFVFLLQNFRKPVYDN